MAETTEETKRTPEEKLAALMGTNDFEGGISCPDCGCRDLRVLETRHPAPGQVHRRRQCRHCGKRMTTVEKAKQ